MDYLPIFIDLRGHDCLVVGGGEVAARKIGLLREAGARVRVVAPEVADAVRRMAAAGEIELHAGAFAPEHLQGARVVVAATADEEVNRRVSTLCQERGIPVNVVDDPALCSFIVPSIIDRSPVQVAVSTGGASPVLARLLRSRLETLIPSAYGRLGALAEDYREPVKARLPDVESRRRFWERVLAGPVAEMVLAGQDRQARAALERELENAAAGGERPIGEVYLVGAGPGDPDLLTFRALRLMQQAEVLVYDRLVSAEILAMARRDAERIYVGKERAHHTLPQEGINELLVRLAREGRRVCRLKGGDPFIFGRGGEEIDTLAAEGIPFQVVPAVTAAAGVASYAGIPLTHRDYSQAVVFATGHLRDGTMNLNWEALAQPRQTVVFYMGLQGLPIICRELIAHGLPPETPVALVQQGTTPNQKIFTGTLETMPGALAREEIRPPTLIIVGEVVRLHEKLRWFDPQHQEQKIFGVAAPRSDRGDDGSRP